MNSTVQAHIQEKTKRLNTFKATSNKILTTFQKHICDLYDEIEKLDHVSEKNQQEITHLQRDNKLLDTLSKDQQGENESLRRRLLSALTELSIVKKERDYLLKKCEDNFIPIIDEQPKPDIVCETPEIHLEDRQAHKMEASLNDRQNHKIEVLHSLHLLNSRKKQVLSTVVSDLLNDATTSLELTKHDIDDDGSVVLAESLMYNNSLTTLILRNIHFSVKGAVILGDILKHNKTLKQLTINGNSIGSNGCKSIGESLLYNTGLAVLNLENSTIGKLGLGHISNGIMHNKTLVSLVLSSNNFSDKSTLESIANTLRNNNNVLQQLIMEGCLLGPGGAIILAEALKYNTHLTSIHLASNKIGDEGAIGFSLMLRENRSLKLIDLPENKIHQRGGISILDSLKVNTSLRSINLSKNDIMKDTLNSIEKVLKNK